MLVVHMKLNEVLFISTTTLPTPILVALNTHSVTQFIAHWSDTANSKLSLAQFSNSLHIIFNTLDATGYRCIPINLT